MVTSMARPRQFDEDAVLAASAKLFRVNGFADTSTEQLCSASGLGRSSLYNTFVSKDELFVRALEHYTSVTRARQEAMLQASNTTAAHRIRMLIDAVVDEEAHAAHAAGCMTVNTLMTPDHRHRDPRIAETLDRDLRARLDSLVGAIQEGHIDRSIDDSVSAEDVAWLIVTVISGIRVSSQAGASPELLRRVGHDGIRSLFA